VSKPIAVLYVEDEPSIAALLRDGLGLFGITVYPIYSSAEPVLTRWPEDEAIRGADVCFFDIRLPGMTGLELARRLREAGDHRPFVIVSAYHPPDPKLLSRLGARFMPKPFDFAAIVALIEELVPRDGSSGAP
jgi:DNA-binding response OmpR family regulator